MIEKRSMSGQKKGRKKDGGRVKEGRLRGTEAAAGGCNVSSGGRDNAPGLWESEGREWQSSQWVGDKATESLLTPTNCSFSPNFTQSQHTHSHRLTSPVADLQRFSTEALEIRGKR